MGGCLVAVTKPRVRGTDERAGRPVGRSPMTTCWANTLVTMVAGVSTGNHVPCSNPSARHRRGVAELRFDGTLARTLATTTVVGSTVDIVGTYSRNLGCWMDGHLRRWPSAGGSPQQHQ
jgi:hypothetical protein